MMNTYIRTLWITRSNLKKRNNRVKKEKKKREKKGRKRERRIYNRAICRNMVRSLSHVRDFVVRWRFSRRKKATGWEADGRRAPAKCPKRAKYYISVAADWTTRAGGSVTRDTCADQRMRATNVLLFKRDQVSL